MKIITSSASHHAMLFAYVTREVVATFGQRGEDAVIRAVRRYGLQRGRRMAMRAKQDGVMPDGMSYDLYGEWECFPGQVECTQSLEDGGYILSFHRCPWHTDWKRFGMMEYGKCYCGYVDAAIIEGLGLENSALCASRMDGHPTCDLRFCDRSYTEEDLRRQQAQKENLHGQEKMPWEYHVGHLYQALRDVLQEEFGSAGRRALKQAMKYYEIHFGPVAKKLVYEYADLNYDVLPYYEGPAHGNNAGEETV